MKITPTIHAELTPDGVYKEYNDPTLQEYKANNFVVTNVTTPKIYTGEILEPVDEPQKNGYIGDGFRPEPPQTNKKYLFVLLGIVAAILIIKKMK